MIRSRSRDAVATFRSAVRTSSTLSMPARPSRCAVANSSIDRQSGFLDAFWPGVPSTSSSAAMSPSTRFRESIPLPASKMAWPRSPSLWIIRWPASRSLWWSKPNMRSKSSLSAPPRNGASASSDRGVSASPSFRSVPACVLALRRLNSSAAPPSDAMRAPIRSDP